VRSDEIGDMNVPLSSVHTGSDARDRTAPRTVVIRHAPGVFTPESGMLRHPTYRICGTLRRLHRLGVNVHFRLIQRV